MERLREERREDIRLRHQLEEQVHNLSELDHCA
jgi:hypothetical protein